jgi:hypothetical protein
LSFARPYDNRQYTGQREAALTGSFWLRIQPVDATDWLSMRG